MNITYINTITEELVAIVSAAGTKEDKEESEKLKTNLEMLLNYNLDENSSIKEVTNDSIEHISVLVKQADDSLVLFADKDYTRDYAIKLRLEFSSFLMELTKAMSLEFKQMLDSKATNQISGEEEVNAKGNNNKVDGVEDTKVDDTIIEDTVAGAENANNNQTSGDDKMNAKQQTNEEKLKAAKEEATASNEKTNKRNLLKTTGIVLAGVAVVGAAVAAGYYYKNKDAGTTIIINNGSDE